MSLNSDYQKLEPGNEIRLYEVDGTAFGVDDVLRFHSHNIAHTPEEISAAGGDEAKLPAKSIWWQGQEYSAWPCQTEGIEASTSGSSAQPKLSVANLDSSITALCLAYDDLLQAKVSIHDTLAQYLDASNFPAGNPTADPTQEKLKVFYIDAKDSETNEVVEFTLSSPMDLQGLMIPTRQLHSLCTWCIRNQYRSGDGCDYAGSRYFDKNNNPVDDPSLDVCNGTLRACKLRFGENNELPFGGFPGTSLIRS
ncbi:phage minor tail protein L [Pluralibacter gergoviae]|uniref:phage minor tail protein L n=1 Tax=Pluralibacter gergoviae TaxID=61647 RepID=UPI000651F6F6|nr:phage minor tail protein L [Pluralibacter gergoviae]KMK30170.1 phage minor tail protein L [Pluralibacter gergoviae]KMK43605.1 phage minor tail protein L [Pluralibacter gergoviae]SUB72149.1 phage minor tail protein L [Pluralibacter gergoviae]